MTDIEYGNSTACSGEPGIDGRASSPHKGLTSARYLLPTDCPLFSILLGSRRNLWR